MPNKRPAPLPRNVFILGLFCSFLFFGSPRASAQEPAEIGPAPTVEAALQDEAPVPEVAAPVQRPAPSVFDASNRFDQHGPSASAWASVHVTIDADGHVVATTSGWLENREKWATVYGSVFVRIHLSDGSKIEMRGYSERTGYGISCGNIFGIGDARPDGSACAVGAGLGTPVANHIVAPGTAVVSAEIYPWAGMPQFFPSWGIGFEVVISR